MDIRKKSYETVKNHPYLLRGSLWRDTYNRLKRFIDPDDLILDVGSLQAPYTRYMENHVIAIDLPSDGTFGFSDEMFRELKQFKNITPIYADVEKLPFDNDTFDKIICTEVFEHLYHPENALSEMNRVLKPGGKLFITTPNGAEVPLESGIKEHVYHYSEKELKKLVKPLFKNVKVEKRFHYYNILTIQDRYYIKWDKSNSIISLFWGFMIFLSGWFYELLYKLESCFKLEGKYNLVLTAQKQI